MLERGWALEFAREWIESWNSHDLERILAHYTEDFEMSSPLIVERLEGPRGDSPARAASLLPSKVHLFYFRACQEGLAGACEAVAA